MVELFENKENKELVRKISQKKRYNNLEEKCREILHNS